MTKTPTTRLRTADSPLVRFHLLDVARGLAALAVLFWHYQHFYFSRAESGPSFTDWNQLPLYSLFEYLYRYGYSAVQFFWVLSGFVLANAYWQQKSTARDFFIKRFSRIYPLHFITLIAVALLQALSLQLVGHWQIYGHNDLYHFFLQLFLIADWGLQDGYSFNAPIWSVSLEIFIYFVFFLTLPLFIRKHLLFALSGVAFFSALILLAVPGPFWWCGYCFFLGVTIYSLWQALKNRNSLRYVVAALLFATGVVSLLEVEWVQMDAFNINLYYFALGLFFSGIVLFIACVENVVPTTVLSRTRWLGDASFGIYLWHIPVQILALTVIQYYKVDSSVVDHPLFLGCFLFIVTLIAWISFVFYEKPIRKYIRARLIG